MRVRLTLLPFVAGLATISIILRTPAVYDSLSRLTPALNTADAQGSTKAQPAVPPPAGKTEPAQTPANAQPNQAATGAANAAPAPDPLAFDPEKLTAGEVDVLQSLAKRRTELDARERELGSRDALVAAAEARVDKKLAEVKAVEAQIASLKTEQSKEQSAQVERLVKIYETMKPGDAANIFNTLDMNILLGVARQMQERKFAPILAAMDPERAKALTVQLATQQGDGTMRAAVPVMVAPPGPAASPPASN